MCRRGSVWWIELWRRRRRMGARAGGARDYRSAQEPTPSEVKIGLVVRNFLSRRPESPATAAHVDCIPSLTTLSLKSKIDECSGMTM